ncbi:hypothetical protein AGABI2DRAFT_180496 [Agaricus bisporus var. bisporus H97]|uniref:hypothetical protein n=1 Tax=Agaricus bisporus var. bisporus (strain H97 / ATCC MYA-4626 / FGSC 10389) TaxID=936046 RepID=UPI00029F70DD|nr:hypothetical protein AGABI2DRAFT_180496 [Agaricus bisporus var. bisporus H97]EKV44173.1 hypothetical protein AGABI2DRAFT_180496 [Agaricus bisporus var. bisporus H97]
MHPSKFQLSGVPNRSFSSSNCGRLSEATSSEHDASCRVVQYDFFMFDTAAGTQYVEWGMMPDFVMETFTDQLSPDDSGNMHAHADAAAGMHDDAEPRSVLDDDSDGEDGEDYMDDDRSSSLSIPNESIDFDLVYSLHSFAATVDGQANVVKGDRLFLIDDSNSYWWLVRVLKTQEVGYIPAENIETPFERLARLNKHRNVDLASATQAELQGDLNASQDRLRLCTGTQSPSPIPPPRGRSMSQSRRLTFTASMSVHRYAPAIWDEEDEDEEDAEFDVGEFMMSDPELAIDEEGHRRGGPGSGPMDVDDGMQWEDSKTEDAQAEDKARMNAQASLGPGIPDSLQAGGPGREAPPHMSQQQQAQMMMQQQRQQGQQAIVQQQLQQQQQQHQRAAQQQPQDELMTSGSKERLSPSDTLRPGSSSPNSRQLDPANAPDTVSRKSLTPGVARDDSNTTFQKEDERAKRLRQEEEEEAVRNLNKGARDKETGTLQSSLSQQKLTKQRKVEASKEEEDSGGRKKRGVFSGLFGGRRKDKSKEKNASVTSFDSADTRVSEESAKSSRPSHASSTEGVLSPTTNLALQQQQQQAIATRSIDIKAINPTSERIPQVSLHASQLRQHDQQQQALYQQYLKSSPSSPPEPNLSYGLQTHSTVLGANAPGGVGANSGLGPPAPRQRPGSLILTSTSLDGAFPGVQQELSVIRIFAGKHLQTDATFKTALLNSSTVASDLVRQAIQRFRLPGGEVSSDYYLTVKQVEGGSSTVLHDHENPLVVFETLVNEAMEMPKVKRSSMGSISSISSNLSMHPAIKKLPMNDFTDDSAVKFYLNRKGEEGGVEESLLGHDAGGGVVEDSYGSSSGGEGESGDAGVAILGDTIVRSPKSQLLSVSAATSSVSSERFTSPSIRFPLQLVIYREDLPDDMVFHPTTEAIVFKDHLRDSDLSTQGGGVNPMARKKVFMFPRNVTVAEVIEMGLDRFGILEGVVDGGDEVEDKSVKRRSSPRVRYGLWVGANGHDRELTPSSKVVDAFPRPPTFKSPTSNGNNKRRSVDSVQLLGSMDDVQPEDPVFRLRRATSYRNSTSRHRMSAPLDEIALQRLHRESSSSGTSQTSTDQTHTPHMYPQHHQRQISLQQLTQQPVVQATQDIGSEEDDHDHEVGLKKQRSAQEIIAAQRAASRANQKAILSAQPNLLRGTDILLPDNALLRSSRYDSTEKMRYSYVEPDGETTYDISDIVEAEWRDGDGSSGQSSGSGDDDLLARVVGNADLAGAGGPGKNQPRLGANLVRVLSKIRDGKAGRGGDDDSKETVAAVSQAAQDLKGDDKHHDEIHHEERDSIVDDTVVVGGLAALGVGGMKDLKRDSSVPSVSEYSVDDSLGQSRSTTPGSAGFVSRMPGPMHGGSPSGGTFASIRSQQHSSSRSVSSVASSFDERAVDRSSPISPRSNTTTPTGRPVVEKRRQPSLASVMSDTTTMSTSGFVTPPMYPYTPPPLSRQLQDSPKSFASVSTAMSAGGSGSIMGSGSPAMGKKKKGGQRQPILPKDDFGISHMMTIIEYKAAQLRKEKALEKQLAHQNQGQMKTADGDMVDERLFGKRVDLDSFHPEIKSIYESGFKKLEEMDKVLDSYVKPSISAF